jgi:hypothetical protein
MHDPVTQHHHIATLAEARATCVDAPREWRIRVVEDFDHQLSRNDFYRLLGEQWTSFGHLRWHARFLREHLRAATEEDILAMMTAEEAQLLQTLPMTFTVYRGCYHHNVEGFSWCFDREAAALYPYEPEF